MATRKEVKNRISSVKNVEKITRAMEMVAAARLRRAEQRIEHLRPYGGAFRRMTRQAAEAAESLPKLPILQEHDEVRRVALLLVTGDRGLAGAFNSQILRAGLRAGSEHESEGRSVSWYASGRRGVSSLSFRGKEVKGRYVGFTDRPAYADAREIAEDLMAGYVDDEIDAVEIFYNGYISPLRQEVRRETLLPLQHATVMGEEDEEDEDEPDREEQRVGKRVGADRGPDPGDEPSPPGGDHAGDHGSGRRRRGPERLGGDMEAGTEEKQEQQ